MKKIVKTYSRLPIEIKKPMTDAAQKGKLQKISFNFKGVDRPAYFYNDSDTEYLVVMDEIQTLYAVGDDEDDGFEDFDESYNGDDPID